MIHQGEWNAEGNSFVSELVKKLVSYLPSVGISVVVSAFVALFLIGAMSNEREILTIDAKRVVKAFVEERGVALSEDKMSLAVREFDALVMAEAEKINAETGAIIVNSNHMLAGGRDVSVPFAKRVISTWDSIHPDAKNP